MLQILFLGIGIISIVFLLVIVFLLFKIIRGIFRILSGVIAIIMIALVAVGFIGFLDFMDLKENFQNSESLVILEENGNAKAAAVLNEGNFEFLENFSSYNNQLKEKDYKGLLDGYYKLIIIKNESLGFEAGLSDLLPEYHKGNIIIYPETFLFKIVKRIPISFEIPFRNTTLERGDLNGII